MNLRSLVTSASAAALLALALVAPACSLLNGADAKDQKLCTAGGFVFCRCADRTEGTKQCKADAQSFEACQTPSNGACSGGEVSDPRTNQPVKGKDDPTPATPDGPGVTSQLDTTGSVAACPGKSTAVVPTSELTLEDDTTTATGDHNGKTGACIVGLDGKDHIYHLLPTGSGSLDVAVQGEGALTPLVYVRTTCDDKETQVACGPPEPGAVATARLNVIAGKDYFLFIDGASGTAGKYTVKLKLTTQSFCGDGKIDPGEACDDANKKEGDGCSNDCHHVDGNPATGGSCAGHPVDVWPGAKVTGSGSTNTYGNTWTAPGIDCDVAGGNGYQDHVYKVTSRAKGNLVVAIAPPASGPLNDHMLSARTTCDDPRASSFDMCANENMAGQEESMRFAVEENQTLWVAVDGGGQASNKGDYTITFVLQ